MGMYSLKELLSRWQKEQLSIEQAIGQMLQHLLILEKELKRLRRQLPNSAPPPKRNYRRKES